MEAKKSLLAHFKSFFLHGLFSILPIILTIFILTFTYNIVERWLSPLTSALPDFLQKIPGSAFIIVTIVILCIGFLLKIFFIKTVIRWFEHLVAQVPLIRTIYSSTKNFVDFFNIPGAKDRKGQVILFEFPRAGFYSIGFLLEPATDTFQKLIPKEKLAEGKMYYKIFMPNSPNPTSGFFLVLSEDEFIRTNITFDEAIKAVVSCGLITPESLKSGDIYAK